MEHNNRDIEAKVLEIFKPTYDFYDVEVGITLGRDGRVEYLDIGQEYEPIEFNFQMALDIMKYLGASSVDDDTFAESGCETCDYGSRYGVTLRFKYD